MTATKTSFRWHRLHFVELLILGLGVWRIARLLQYERGPLSVFARLRGRLGVQHDEDGEPLGWPDSEAGRLLRCLDCGSVWVGLGMAGLYLWQPALVLALALPFALSAAAIGWNRMVSQ